MHERVIINNYSFAKHNSYLSLNLFNLFGIINVIINKLLTLIYRQQNCGRRLLWQLKMLQRS